MKIKPLSMSVTRRCPVWKQVLLSSQALLVQIMAMARDLACRSAFLHYPCAFLGQLIHSGAGAWALFFRQTMLHSQTKRCLNCCLWFCRLYFLHCASGVVAAQRSSPNVRSFLQESSLLQNASSLPKQRRLQTILWLQRKPFLPALTCRRL